MKKYLLIVGMIVLIALAFSFCSNSSSGPTPDFKYLGTWIGQNSYAYPVEIHVEKVSNEQKVTYIKLIAVAKSDSVCILRSSTSGLAKVTDDSFSYSDTSSSTTVVLNGTFQSETSLSGDFTITYSKKSTFQGTYTATKQ